ncbi:MAG: hypothetical protein ACRYE8_06585, partial [Janthinobacterium lividum]
MFRIRFFVESYSKLVMKFIWKRRIDHEAYISCVHIVNSVEFCDRREGRAYNNRRDDEQPATCVQISLLYYIISGYLPITSGIYFSLISTEIHVGFGSTLKVPSKAL